MAVVDDPSSGVVWAIDEAYEYSAPRFFDFINGETEEDMRKAEMWFEGAATYAPSPFMSRIRTGRSVQVETICDFSEQIQQDSNLAEAKSECNVVSVVSAEANNQTSAEAKELVVNSNELKEEQKSEGKPDTAPVSVVEVEKELSPDELQKEPCSNLIISDALEKHDLDKKKSSGQDVCTPAPTNSRQGRLTDSKKHQTAKKIASILKNPSELKSKHRSQESLVKSSNKPTSLRKNTKDKPSVEATSLALYNQAIKKQKLDGGKAREILNVNKPLTLPHKGRPGLTGSSSKNVVSSSIAYTRKEDRKIYVREPAIPFVSTAEMMRKFQSNTRDMSLSRMSSTSHQGAGAGAGTTTQGKAKLTLTRPKTPEFETALRVRSVKIKSSAELEEEMLAKIPKFKARPLNKKILETPSLPAIPRSTPQPPVFKEFHLETRSRANQNAETSTVASTESNQNHHHHHQGVPHLTAPKSPVLQTSLRARPTKVKSTEELEKEELEKIPKFKARPLNKKIFESEGELGMFCNTKKQVTIPQEFHFVIDERIPPPPTDFTDMFDKLSLKSEHQHSKPPLPRLTAPNPFHLHTEERGAEKENRLMSELMRKQWEEERARIPKASPYPYTTDYPVVPPKPEPKPCTKPEPFQLESLARHEEEMQREMEERKRMEMEEAQMRLFKAQPVLKEDPIPLPKKERKPLTEVEEFNHHVDHRAVDREEFDKKIKEKETMYKRYRDEAESAKLMEEEKALKQLRRTLVPHARPVPKFDQPFLPQKSSKQATKPKSPRLQIRQRKERKAMVYPASSSSCASQMR